MDNPRIDLTGNKRWWSNGKVHRTDGPAIEYTDGTKFWVLNGDVHRTDGPAVEWPSGHVQWFLNRQGYTFDTWLEMNTDLTHEQKVIMKLQYG
jgi:hypothetical protein